MRVSLNGNFAVYTEKKKKKKNGRLKSKHDKMPVEKNSIELQSIASNRTSLELTTRKLMAISFSVIRNHFLRTLRRIDDMCVPFRMQIQTYHHEKCETS